MFTFTPLLGSQPASRASQSVLELDGGIKILVDVGWDVAFDAEQLSALQDQVPALSLILLTHATVDRLGAYAHACKHIPLFSQVPAYATTPVVNLGRTMLTDLYASSLQAASALPPSALASSAQVPAPDNILMQPPTRAEIATYFSRIVPLKYSQPHQPSPSSWSPSVDGLTVTAYCAGHTLGGTVWHIQHGMESIVYAVDFNLARERMTPATSLLVGGSEVIEPLRRPTALICGAKGVERTGVLRGKDRDAALINLVYETIRLGGKVVIPSDSSARILELGYLLNHHWSEKPDLGKQAQLYMATRDAKTTTRLLKGMLEWVDDSVRSDADALFAAKMKDGNVPPNPLEWSYVKVVQARSQLQRVVTGSKPCVILASDSTLDWGLSRQALQSLADDPRNLVVLPEPLGHGYVGGAQSLGKILWDMWQKGAAGRAGVAIDGNGAAVEYSEVDTAQLDAGETELFDSYLARQQQLFGTKADDRRIDTEGAVDVQDESESDEDDDDDQQGRALNVSSQLKEGNKQAKEESAPERLLLKGEEHDYDVRNKRGLDRLFPFKEERVVFTEYGQAIKANDYLRAEERQAAANEGESGSSEAAVGKKRKWDSTRGGGKKAYEPDDIDEAIARATGQTLPDGRKVGKREDEIDSDAETEDEEFVPSKLLRKTGKLNMRMRLAHVDFTSLHEKRDIQMIVSIVRPRKLIITGGDLSERQSLAESCREAISNTSGNDTSIAVPGRGETVDASMDINAWTLKLSRDLLKRFRTWQTIRPGLQIMALAGELGVEDDDIREPKRQKLDPDAPPEKKPSLPLLMPLSQNTFTSLAALSKSAQPIHVGDLRIQALRSTLQSRGHTCIFSGDGGILVDNTVLVRKSSHGIEIQSATQGLGLPSWNVTDSETGGSFYSVRKAVYEGLAVV
ncbi:hypothetical protein K470DRAFT_254772 [Piedraia hortae CBS 480.64]|uniref:Cleavage and polyadenylation specificity factor subunit 2 n=1 Tax=Piedraia hortae CBS 480.64 TaxID=1314780 RepID=A0A6A7C9K6_9PEZI|nr:hypothetical protein K470DRAFT_254772 [Piedraia hortae CBS 480.64]